MHFYVQAQHDVRMTEFTGNEKVYHYSKRILCSWDRASLMYSSITSKTQCYTTIFITIIALHVSGSSSAHHQELKTVYTASGIC